MNMKDSGVKWIGSIPGNWSVQRVKHAFVRKNEKAMQDEPVVLSLARSGVKIRDISNNKGQIAESYYNYNPVEEGDLLLNPMDLYSGANCSISKVKGVISPAYINLKNKEGYHSCFYDYYFKVQYWMMAFFAHGKGVSFDNRWTLSVETLMNYPIVVLDYVEQCKRADYLDERCLKIDLLIEKQQAIIEKLKEYKYSCFSEILDQKCTSCISLGKIIDKIEQGWSPSPIERKDENGWKVLTLAAVKYGKFNGRENKPFEGSQDKCERLLLAKGDFLLTRSNTRELVGQVCIVGEVEANTIFSDLIYRITFNTSYILPEYALYAFQSPRMRQQISRDAHGSSSTMVKITHKDIANWEIGIPTIEEQYSIVDKLRKIEAMVDKDTKKREVLINKLQEYKKSLIYEVVTGKKEVR